MAKGKEVKKVSFFKTISRFFKDVRGEMRNIRWPSMKQLRNNTIIVLVMMVLVGLFIWLVDIGMGAITQLLLKA